MKETFYVAAPFHHSTANSNTDMWQITATTKRLISVEGQMAAVSLTLTLECKNDTRMKKNTASIL